MVKTENEVETRELMMARKKFGHSATIKENRRGRVFVETISATHYFRSYFDFANAVGLQQ